MRAVHGVFALRMEVKLRQLEVTAADHRVRPAGFDLHGVAVVDHFEPGARAAQAQALRLAGVAGLGLSRGDVDGRLRTVVHGLPGFLVVVVEGLCVKGGGRERCGGQQRAKNKRHDDVCELELVFHPEARRVASARTISRSQPINR
ncbi:hypothetical protein D9M72_582720 [compost metagenome]